MITRIFILAMFMAVAPIAASLAGQERGGGDMCGKRIQDIRNDIASWIDKGGARGLNLPNGMTADEYARRMHAKFASAKVKCVGPGDADYPVHTNNVPTTCRFEQNAYESAIICDIEKFNRESEDRQYVLVHHEYAAAAGIEPPRGTESNYDVSNQISLYIEDRVERKLAVRPVTMPWVGWKQIDGKQAVRTAQRLHDILLSTSFVDCEVEASRASEAKIYSCDGESFSTSRFFFKQGTPSASGKSKKGKSQNESANGFHLDVGAFRCNEDVRKPEKLSTYLLMGSDTQGPIVWQYFHENAHWPDPVKSGRMKTVNMDVFYHFDETGTYITKVSSAFYEFGNVVRGTIANPISTYERIPLGETVVCNARR